MTDPRESDRLRFRAHLEARARKILDCLPRAFDDLGGGAPRRELLGELHTLKGEARMLGETLLAQLVHEIEDRLAVDSEPDRALVAAVCDAIVLSLSESTSEADRRGFLATALLSLDVEPLAPIELERPTSEAPISKGFERRWVQVDAALVEDLSEMLAAVVTSQARLDGSLGRALGAGRAEVSGNVRLQRDWVDDSRLLKQRLGDALELSLRLRLAPLAPVFARLGAHARLLAQERGKSLEVRIDAGGVEIERASLDALHEALIHLVNNAIEHGIEALDGDRPTLLELGAESAGAEVLVRVRDEGKGIDVRRVVDKAVEEGRVDRALAARFDADEALELLFLPGLSTRETADEGAGRGVGLDVVRRQIEALGGRVGVTTTLGRGTTFSLAVPLSMSREQLIVLEARERLYALPARFVRSIEARVVVPSDTYVFRGEIVPFRSLLGLLDSEETNDGRTLVLVAGAGRSIAARSPRVIGQFELVRRATSPRFGRLSGVVASAEFDDGRPVLVLDPEFVRVALTRGTEFVGSETSEAEPEEPGRVLIVDDSVVVRDLLANVLRSAGYRVDTARDGRDALEMVERREPGLVVTDVEMPEMDGFELLGALRERTRTLPVVLVTARSSAEDRERAAALGASAYVAKGEFRNETLLAVVARYLPVRA